jgi:hypothetical protein
MLHDDCLGRTLDWLYEHDPTALFAGIARQACHRSLHGPPRQDLANLDPLHEQIATLLGPSCEKLYKVDD